jgi:hypothetical protein
MATRYLLLVFGDAEVHYHQAQHAILSLLAFAPPEREVVVVTDRPRRFAWLAGAVAVAAVDAATLTAWRGSHGFFWRIKIEALRQHAGDGRTLVYLDSDVLVRRDLGDFLAHLAGGGTAMHLREFNLAARRRRGDRALYAQAGGREWGGMRLDGSAWMWNAGVVAVGPDGRGRLERALAACDELCAAIGTHSLNEQLALSLALGEGGRLIAAAPWIDHYWDNKPGYLESILAEQARFLIEGIGPAEAAAWLREHPIQRPLKVRLPWWRKRLLRLLSPPR